MNSIQYKPIGIIHSPFTELKGTPIQSAAAEDVEGSVEVFPEFREGLQDLEGFSHIILLYHFHLIKTASLKAIPFMDDREHGIFAIRGPRRPNSIGMSVVKLNKIEDNILSISGLDILEGTPLLDIKPYVPEFDRQTQIRKGWLEDNINKLSQTRDDGRFEEQ